MIDEIKEKFKLDCKYLYETFGDGLKTIILVLMIVLGTLAIVRKEEYSTIIGFIICILSAILLGIDSAKEERAKKAKEMGSPLKITTIIDSNGDNILADDMANSLFRLNVILNNKARYNKYTKEVEGGTHIEKELLKVVSYEEYKFVTKAIVPCTNRIHNSKYNFDAIGTNGDSGEITYYMGEPKAMIDAAISYETKDAQEIEKNKLKGILKKYDSNKTHIVAVGYSRSGLSTECYPDDLIIIGFAIFN